MKYERMYCRVIVAAVGRSRRVAVMDAMMMPVEAPVMQCVVDAAA